MRSAPLVRAFLLFSIVGLTGGCVAASSSDGIGPNDPGQTKFSHDRAVHYDLTTPPTPTQLGVPPGETSALFGRGPGDPLWDITFTLPEHKTFHVKAFGVGVDFWPADQAAQNQITVNTSVNTNAEMDVALKQAITVLGLNPSEVAIWEHELAAYPLSNVNFSDNFVFHARKIGYLTIEVEARVEQGSPGASINYMFSFGPQPGPPPLSTAAPSVNPKRP
jgi:hypothetical protein